MNYLVLLKLVSPEAILALTALVVLGLGLAGPVSAFSARSPPRSG